MSHVIIQARAKQEIAENMRKDFEKDRDKMKKVNIKLQVFQKCPFLLMDIISGTPCVIYVSRTVPDNTHNNFSIFYQEIQLEFEHEKEARKAAAEKHQLEIDKNVDLSMIKLEGQGFPFISYQMPVKYVHE